MSLHQQIHESRDPDSFNIRRPIARVKAAALRHKWLVLLTTLSMVALVSLYVWLWPAIYQAKVLVYVESDKDQHRVNFYDGWNVFRMEDAKSQPLLIKAGPVVEAVVDDLNLKYDDVYHSFLAHASELWRQSWVGKQYRSLKEMVFPPKKSEYEYTPEEKERAKAIQGLRSGISVLPVKDSQVGEITVRGPSPRVADMANKLIDTYLAKRQERLEFEARRAFESLKTQFEQTEAELRKSEEDLQEWTRKHRVYFDFAKEQEEVKELVKLRSNITVTMARIAGLEKSRDVVLRQLAEEPPEYVRSRNFITNPLRRRMQTMRLDRESALITLRQYYAPDAREVRDVEEVVAELGKRIEASPDKIEDAYTREKNTIYESMRNRLSSVELELAGARAQLEVEQRAYDELRARLDSLPDLRKEMYDLARTNATLEDKYVKLRDKYVAASVSYATLDSAAPTIRVIEYASRPTDPSWPKTKLLVLVALLLGLGLGITAAVLLDLYSNRVRLESLEEEVAEMPFLARIDIGANGGDRLLRKLANGRRERAGSNGGGV